MIVRKTAWFLNALLLLLRCVVLARTKGCLEFKGKVQTKYTVPIGYAVKLRCPATGTDDPLHNRTLVVWFFKGDRIDRSLPNWSRFFTKNGYLNIRNVNVTDAGVYVCQAHNECGSIKLSITLAIEYKKQPRGSPPKFKLSQKRVMTFRTGETAKLKCDSTGDPDPEILWFKDGESYRKNKRTSVSHNGWTLNLRYLTESDSGKYSCRVSNKLGSINRTFTVRVKARVRKPLINDPESTNVGVHQGKNATLVCRVSSLGGTTFKWRRWGNKVNGFNGSRVLRDSKRFRSKYDFIETQDAVRSTDLQGILVIKNATDKDGGKYTCVVRNGYGADRLHLYLHVISKDNDQRTATTPAMTSTTPAMTSTSASLQARQTTKISPILVVGLTAAIVIAMLFVVILILCCRKQRKDMEKEYVIDYKPADLVQYNQQTSVCQEMQKVAHDISPGNTSSHKSWSQPYDCAMRTLQDVREHLDRRLASAKETSPSCCLGNRRDSEETLEASSSSDLNHAHSQTSSQTTLDRKRTNSGKSSSDCQDDANYSIPHARPPDSSQSIFQSPKTDNSQTYVEDSRESIV